MELYDPCRDRSMRHGYTTEILTEIAKMFPTITELQQALNQGSTTSVALTEAALARIASSAGEGATAFIQVYQAQAMAAAQASDTLRAAGLQRSPIDGLPISIKDLFDVRGSITRGGSAVLSDAPPASSNALLVQRLIDAGAVIIGRTNMTEFAFSGLGINPHYGTPRAPWDREIGRIPGGSSSGAGVSVADGMAVVAIGTDTGGSIRIPSAFCGITGFKPTASRIPSDGTLPLSSNLDSSGPLARSVECCAIVDAILAGERYEAPQPLPFEHLRFAIPNTVIVDGADNAVREAFLQMIELITAQGATVEYVHLPEFEQLAYINRQGGFVCADAWAFHRQQITQHREAYDPRVVSRILRGKDMSAADYIDLLETRSQWIAGVEARLESYDALLMPTSPIVPPVIAELQASDDAYFQANGLILRNPTLINFLNGCALSLPCHQPGSAPVGLMVAAPAMHDKHLLRVGVTLEPLLPGCKG